MIKTKMDLKFYLAADKYALGRDRSRPSINDDVWKFQRILRKVEYYKNKKPDIISKLLLPIYQLRKYKLGISLGFDIPTNVFGPGLRINHFGNIVVSKSAVIGMWCDIHQGVNIGSNNSVSGQELVPRIGNNVWIGPGVKIFGDIEIGNEVQIAANAVVNKSVCNNKTVGGIPAKVISDHGTENVNVAASKARMMKFIELHPQFRQYFNISSVNVLENMKLDG
ncbi:MAG: serine acetyltransferase [Alteromonadaceae bacterium]|nr:serine acetyltransferase [Alteromonadaceae bacterium]